MERGADAHRVDRHGRQNRPQPERREKDGLENQEHAPEHGVVGRALKQRHRRHVDHGVADADAASSTSATMVVVVSPSSATPTPHARTPAAERRREPARPGEPRRGDPPAMPPTPKAQSR